jgi:hypothetical protein
LKTQRRGRILKSSIATQFILQLAKADRLEHDYAISACLLYPSELFTPVVRAWHKAGHRSGGERLADRDAHLMALIDQPQVHRAEITRFGDAEKPHGELLAYGTA